MTLDVLNAMLDDRRREAAQARLAPSARGARITSLLRRLRSGRHRTARDRSHAAPLSR